MTVAMVVAAVAAITGGEGEKVIIKNDSLLGLGTGYHAQAKVFSTSYGIDLSIP